MTMKTALVVLAHGFEEVEALCVIDVLRRADVSVTVAGLDYPVVTSARSVQIIADATLASVKTQLFDVVILPGGEPGTTNLEASRVLADVLNAHYSQKRLLAAICAAPRLFDALGFLQGKCATAYPGVSEKMTHCIFRGNATVVVDGGIITANGPSASFHFAFAILKSLTTPEIVEQLKLKMGFDS